MRKNLLRSCIPALFAAGLLAGGLSAGSSAETAVSLSELLRSTHVHGLAIDRADRGSLLIATHHGLYRARIDSGTAELASERTDDFMGFTPHPTDEGVLYASGHPAGGGNLGFIASQDGGRSWSSLAPGVGGPVDFHQMDVSKADPSVIYGVHGGLQTSRDGGRTWERVGAAPEGLIDLAASAREPARLYAATQQGILVSQDGGAGWELAHELHRPVSLVETTGDGTVFAFMLGSGLIRAEEPFLNWQLVSDVFGDRYLLHLAADPGDLKRLFAVTQNSELLASDDAGTSWRVLAQP